MPVMKQARNNLCNSWVRTFRTAQDGAIAVEFALVFPVFLLVVFGIIVYGSYLAVVHGVQQLAAEAARSSIAASAISRSTSPSASTGRITGSKPS